MERREAGLKFRIVRGCGEEYADAPHALGLLRVRGERIRRRRCGTGRKRDELPPLHSITSSARASREGDTVRPRVFAVFKLTTSSNLVGACTGRSAGFSPFRMRST